MTPSLPLRSAVDLSLQASKWQQCPVLLDEHEMQALLAALGNFWIVQVSGLIPVGQEIISQQAFLEHYQQYIAALKSGEQVKNAPWRACFSSVFTTTLEALYAVPVNPTHCLVKVAQPVIQLQAHRFDYSVADQTFRSMVMGYDSIQWGLQFSYPHLYQDANLQVFKVREGNGFPNTALFKRLQQWMRAHTIATPFEMEGKRVNVPIRLGKQCFSWINTHPQLQTKGLRVVWARSA
jgi:hypothetical protein